MWGNFECFISVFGEPDFPKLYVCARVGAKKYFDLIWFGKIYVLEFCKTLTRLYDLPIL